MSRSLFFWFFILFSVMELAGQDVIDIEADYVDQSTYHCYLYSEIGNGNYQGKKVQIDQNSNPHKITFTVFETISKKELLSRSSATRSIIAVDSLRGVTVSDFKRSLEEKDYYYTMIKEYFGFSHSSSFLYDHFLIRNNNKSGVLSKENFKYSSIILRLNRVAPILLLASSKNPEQFTAAIFPYKKGLFYNKHAINPIDSYTQISKSEFEKWRLNSFVMDWSVYSKSNYDLKDKVFNKSLFKKSYDSLKQTWVFYIGYYKNRVDVFNYRLDHLPIQEFRKAFTNSRFDLEVLDGNKVKYLDLYGNVSSEIPPLKKKKFFENTRFNKKIIKEDGYFIMESSTSHTGSITQSVKQKVCSISKYQSLTFGNGDSVQYLHPDKLKNILYYFGNFLIGKTDSGYDLIPYSISLDKGLHGMIEKVVDIHINENKTVNFDQIYLEDSYKYLKVQKDGLFGLYNFHEKPKFKQLGVFNENFARVQFKDGSMGWIDIDNNKYLDQ